MRKLKQKSGETLAEVLIAVLVMTIAFVILTGAVAAAARVNYRAENKSADLASTAASESKVQVSVYGLSPDVSYAEKIKLYKNEDSGYYYYDHINAGSYTS